AALQPPINVQTGPPDLTTRAGAASLARDVIVLVPSVEADSAELIAARAAGGWLIQRTRRSGADLRVHSARLTRFFYSPLRRGFDDAPLAPIVFSWLAGRGRHASRVDPHDVATRRELEARLRALLRDDQLFVDRLDQRGFA